MTTTLARVGMSLEDFNERYSDEGPFELIEGEMIPVAPQAIRSTRAEGRLFILIDQYLATHGGGEVFMQGAFVLHDAVTDSEDRSWVRGSRVPDVMLVTAARMAQLEEAYPGWDAGPLPIVPDWVAEVISPSDKWVNVQAKVERYLADGVRLVWVIDPDNALITTYTAQDDKTPASIAQYRAEDTLSAAPILPEFSLRPAELLKAQ